jgi:transcriptional regulator with XRE-family HTH domain
MKFPNRIREMRELRGLSQKKLADAVGTSQPQIDRLEKGDRGLDQDWMFRLAKALDCQPADLLPLPMGGPDVIPVRRIQILGDVQAGFFREAVEWPPEDRFEFDAIVAPAYQKSPVFGLKVLGPSMNRVFPEGSFAICTKLLDLGEDFELQSGKFVVVLRHSPNGLDEWEATIKQYEVDGSGTAWLWPRSDHPEFQTPIKVTGRDGRDYDDPNEEVVIWALVIGKHESF